MGSRNRGRLGCKSITYPIVEGIVESVLTVDQNRVTTHSALLDWDDGQRRHLARITPQAERPEETPFDEK